MDRPNFEVADVFRRYGEAYRQEHGASLSTAQRRAMTAIEVCRTAVLGGHLVPFTGTVRSVGWGIFVTDGSSAEGTALLPSVSPTIDWVRLPQRFPVRIQVDKSAQMELRIGQTASVAISHGARSYLEKARIPE